MSERAFAASNGIRLCYETFGDRSKPPMLLIMGLAAQMIVWDDEFCTRLADRGRQWVLTERTGAAHGQLYHDVYQELMDRWRPAGQPAGRAGKPT